MSDIPSFWPFLLAVLGAYGFGSALGYRGCSVSWKPGIHLGAACLGICEPILFYLYNSGRLGLVEAFRAGGALAIVGALALGFGLQRFIKAQKASRSQSAGE
jgi:hypothetical protein